MNIGRCYTTTLQVKRSDIKSKKKKNIKQMIYKGTDFNNKIPINFLYKKYI